MQITIELPDDIARQLAEKTSDLSQKTLESLIIEAYRTGVLTSTAVGRVLNLGSDEVDSLLKQTRPMRQPPPNQLDSEQLPNIAQAFDEIRQICIEEDFQLDLPSRQDRHNPLLSDDVSF